MTRRRRVLLYSHDTYGLGHLRRSMLIAGRLAAKDWVEAVLILSGSPRAQSFETVPGVDLVKLPSVIKRGGGSYQARTLGVGLRQITDVRASVIGAAATSFMPDLVLVDHAPLGMNGELLSLFDEFRGRGNRPAFVLGLRDVVDAADAVREDWSQSGAWRVICEDYDRVVVYGDPSVLTTAQELELDSLLGGRMRHVGYLGRGAASRERSDTPSVLVTVGGGGDGQRLLRAYASAVRQLGRASGLESQIAMGPFLAGRRREQITELFRDVESTVNFVGFEEGLERRIGRAWGVVAMGGYNTTMELLDAEQQALVMPRMRPRLEQAIRASRLSGRSGIEAYLGHRGADARILEFLKRVLEGPVHVKCDVALDGLDVLSQELADVAGVTATDLAKGGGPSADAI